MIIETRAYLENDELMQFRALTEAAKLAAKAVIAAEVDAVAKKLALRSASSQHEGSIPRNLWDDLRLRCREGELRDQLEIDLYSGDRDQRAMILVHDHASQQVEPWKVALVVAAHEFELEFVRDRVHVRREPDEPTQFDDFDHTEGESDSTPPDRDRFCQILTAALFDRIEAEQTHVDILAGDRDYSGVDLVEYSSGSRLLGILQENAVYGWNAILFANLADILSGDLDDTAGELCDLVLEHIDGIENGVAADLLQWDGIREAMIAADLMPFLESLSSGLNTYLDA